MGFLGKFKPKKTEMFSKTKEATTTAPTTQAKPATPSAPKTTSAVDEDDEPTIFSTFMILYYGMFGITLLLYPSVWALDGPFPNPMSYFTTIKPDLQFGMHMVGTGFLVLVLGPFLDDIFGGAGVKFKAFVQQMLLLNLILFFVFLYYSYYAPLAVAIGWIWKAQACMNGFILGWNILEATGSSCKDYYALFTTMYFGFFAFGTMSVPDVLFGPPSPFAYWKSWSDLTMMVCRSFGISMFVLFVLGYVYNGRSGGYDKMCTVANCIFFALFVAPAYYYGPLSVSGMWEIQLAAQIPLVVCGLFLELTGSTGPISISFACPKCGLNAESYNMFNLVFFLPFLAAFCLPDPNLFFGPANPAGMGMFTVDLDEAGLWHGRAWAVVLVLVILGPYLFSMPAIKATKQLTIAYWLYSALFAYSLFVESYEALNTTMIYPLGGLQLIFAFVGTYLCLPAQAGEPML